MNLLICSIPNTLTTLNLFCGIGAIYYISKYNMIAFLYCFVFCLIFDGLDGWYARHANCETQFGKKYDAFADVFSFGLIITVLICKVIFCEPLFWQAMLAGWFTLANVIRYFKLVANKGDKVYGVPNVAISIFILALYFQSYIEISKDGWTYIISVCSFLMLVPVEFINHKKLKNKILPRKNIFGLIYLLPVLLVPYLKSSSLWGVVALVTGLYIGSIWISLTRYASRALCSMRTGNSIFYKKRITVEYSFYSLITSSIVLLRVFNFNV